MVRSRGIGYEEFVALHCLDEHNAATPAVDKGARTISAASAEAPNTSAASAEGSASAPTHRVTMDRSTSEEKKDDHENTEPKNKKQRCTALNREGPGRSSRVSETQRKTSRTNESSRTHPALVPTGAHNAHGWRVCVQCGVFEPFQILTEECCMKENGKPCIFPEF